VADMEGSKARDFNTKFCILQFSKQILAILHVAPELAKTQVETKYSKEIKRRI
jgi:hypothetical protein